MPPKPKRPTLVQHMKSIRKTHKTEVVSPYPDRGISRYTNYEVQSTTYPKPKKMAQTFGSQRKTAGGFVGSTKYKK